MRVPVTTPRCSQFTVDCGPTTVHTAMSPSPNPSTNVLTTGCHTCPLPMVSRKKTIAARHMPAPISSVSRNPSRRKNRPDTQDASGQPTLMAASTAPPGQHTQVTAARHARRTRRPAVTPPVVERPGCRDVRRQGRRDRA